MMDTAAVKARLAQEAAVIEQYLANCLAHIADIPAGLRTSMEYSLHAGGKRIRPVLCLACSQLFGMERTHALPFAVGIECIHTYSLIHDDLPAMDNDDMRRGKPSNHKQFGEATAILAGDGLLTDAFFFMAATGGTIPPKRVLSAIAHIAKGAGSGGMVGGQFLDMQYTHNTATTLDDLRTMHAMKTGALIQSACVSGALLGGADDMTVASVASYGRALGAAFQIADDILDETSDTATLGKPVGSDVAKGKTTYPSLLGLPQSKELAKQEVQNAIFALKPFGQKAEFLSGIAQYVVDRVN